MRVLNKKLTVEQFSEYISNKQFGNLSPNSLVIHHTEGLKKEEWRGEYTLLDLKKYYESKGWPAGPHIFVAEDGIWLFTDMYNVGIHSGKGNATYRHRDGREYQGYDVPSSIEDYGQFRLKEYSIGIEVVGDYDNQKWAGDTERNALYCINMLQKRLDISNENIYFNREFSTKSSPGNAITKQWLFPKLEGLKYTEKKVDKVSESKDKLIQDSEIPVNGEYKIKYDSISVNRAVNLGIMNVVNSEERELIAIASMRTIDYLERRMDSLENKIKAAANKK